jgi:general secretion pathway protein C
MEALLRRYAWAFNLASLAVCAMFLARAATTAIDVPDIVPTVRIAPTPMPPPYDKSIDEILDRNVFCSACPRPTDEAVSLRPERTAMAVSLVAVMYAPSEAAWSVAVIRAEDRRTGVFRVGSRLRTATITSIEATRIHIDNDGRPELLDLLDSPRPSPAPDAFTQHLDRGVRKLGEHAYELRRDTLDAVLGNLGALSRSARIVPETRDGRGAGFRLRSVSPDGAFALIGMQNGDMISSINGLELTSPEKALEAYTKLKSASHLSVGVERDGRRISKEYDIR